MLHQQKTAVNLDKNFLLSHVNLFVCFFFKGLLKEIVREGSDDEIPNFDDRVYIHYIGSLPDGTVFENSRNRPKNISFNLGKGDVLKAWDIGVATMKRGEIARFLSKPKYAYGLKGLEGKVPSATSVFFEIELLDFEGKCKYRTIIIKDIGPFRKGY
jgi:FK506-binding protein 4/5